MFGAYNQIQIKKGDKQKTAFYTHYKYLKYLVMFFGLTNAPVTFQVFINNVFRKYLNIFVIIYFNNILIYSQIEEKQV